MYLYALSILIRHSITLVSVNNMFSKLLGDNVNYSVIVRLLDFRYSKQECHVSSVMFSLQVS